MLQRTFLGIWVCISASSAFLPQPRTDRSSAQHLGSVNPGVRPDKTSDDGAILKGMPIPGPIDEMAHERHIKIWGCVGDQECLEIGFKDSEVGAPRFH